MALYVFLLCLYDLRGPKTSRFSVLRPFWPLKPLKTILKKVLEVLLEVLVVAPEVLEVPLELLSLFKGLQGIY